MDSNRLEYFRVRNNRTQYLEALDLVSAMCAGMIWNNLTYPGGDYCCQLNCVEQLKITQNIKYILT